MPTKVHLPDGRIVHFPDGMPSEQIAAEVRKLVPNQVTARPEDFTQPATGEQLARTDLPDDIRRELEGVQRGAPTPAPGRIGQAVARVQHEIGGAGKGAARSGYNVARGVSMVTPGVDTLSPSPAWMQPAADEQIGNFLEQAGEFVIPAGPVTSLVSKAARFGPAVKAAVKVGANAAASGAMTGVQGGDVQSGTVAGAVLPGVGKVLTSAGEYVGSKAVPLVRAAIKPTVTAMKQQAGASMVGIDAKAKQLVAFILKNRLTSPDKAQAIIDAAEADVKRLVRGARAATDAPQRAARYLQALARSAARQGLPGDDIAIIKSKAKELLEESPLAEDVTKTVMRPSPSGLVDASGKPHMVPTTQTTRALRTDVTPEEALEIARGSGKWGNKKSWGEQKGAATEASKAVERASRDAVKDAVPGVRPALQREGQAIESKKVLDRMKFREGNRDAVSLPAHVIAAGEIARGKVPLLAFAANWLRNNQLKAGVYADRLQMAIKRNDVKTASDILGRLGVGGIEQMQKPQPALAR
jgi:hypothetical protein